MLRQITALTFDQDTAFTSFDSLGASVQVFSSEDLPIMGMYTTSELFTNALAAGDRCTLQKLVLLAASDEDVREQIDVDLIQVAKQILRHGAAPL